MDRRQSANEGPARTHRRRVAAFGAAVSTLAVAHAVPAHGAIINLTVSPGTQPFQGPASGGSFIGLTAPDAAFISFYQYNDTIGKSLNGLGYLGFMQVAASASITPSQTFFGFYNVAYAAGGTQIFGFTTPGGNVGWIKMNLGGPGGPITYLAAAYNNQPGGSIHAGTGAQVPEPATGALAALGVLALGACGVRRLRESRRQAERRADVSAS